VRRREIYHHDDDEEYSQEGTLVPEASSIPEETTEQNPTERDVVEHQGWHNLLWSFAASGFLTVSFFFGVPYHAK
jgi:hypothetical protein